ncbi:hypothetical protein BRADI_1g74127v3 [Brachypodium distachyon]|uniref:Uncharacterized protein n=1 Tax=Brachypodium distachyon TaxID=15368 RepID=A0A2K2DV38_BRADI|nr:hypothetical protein BRADI_1g74127v3 [Brachypodium distachyon]
MQQYILLHTVLKMAGRTVECLPERKQARIRSCVAPNKHQKERGALRDRKQERARNVSVTGSREMDGAKKIDRVESWGE